MIAFPITLVCVRGMDVGSPVLDVAPVVMRAPFTTSRGAKRCDALEQCFRTLKEVVMVVYVTYRVPVELELEIGDRRDHGRAHRR